MGEILPSLRRVGINLSRRARIRAKARYTKVLTVRSRADLPDILNPRRLYKLGEPGKWAVLECPCGRGHLLELNMAHPGRARWRFTASAEGPSLSPSVDFKGERRCHFWLRDGRVRWV